MKALQDQTRITHEPPDVLSDPWSPEGWQEKRILHIPAYPDTAALEVAVARLCAYPPLVLPSEARRLEADLARVAAGRAFLLQGGDCAESFAEFRTEHVLGTSRTLLQMALVLARSGGRPVVRVGRIAGQFAKPRSMPSEVVDGVELLSYRGDMINASAPTAEARTPAPERMLLAHGQAAVTLNLLRSLAQECRPEGALFTSHEALLLHYEQALTRREELTGRWYDTSAHMLWLGDRTRQLDGAHVEFLRGIENPLGVKVGPNATPDEILRLIDRLNPRNRPGRICIITRMGAGQVEAKLPALTRAASREGKVVAWVCDPMHGNTMKAGPYKTRHFDDIVDEARRFFAVHRAHGTYAGGLHLELVGKDVTECIGGPGAVTAASLGERYHTACDPRLNASQSLELASRLAEVLQEERRSGLMARRAAERAIMTEDAHRRVPNEKESTREVDKEGRSYHLRRGEGHDGEVGMVSPRDRGRHARQAHR